MSRGWKVSGGPALAIQERKLGPDDLGVAATLNTLAQHYYTRNKFTNAEPLQERSVAIVEKALGKTIPGWPMPSMGWPISTLARDTGRKASSPKPKPSLSGC